MKIICIGRNYAEHAKEMNAAVPTEPVFFLKPDTSLLKITKNGKNIDEAFAHKYYDEIGIGIDFTARDIQATCKDKGLPWEKAKAFDNAAPLGQFIDKEKIKDLRNINFHLLINGKTVQKGNTKDLLFSFDTIIASVSKFITLKTGDLIYTGTPEGVGPVKIGDHLEGYFEKEKLLDFEIK
jgi:acylpyruvate hydrolase